MVACRRDEMLCKTLRLFYVLTGLCSIADAQSTTASLLGVVRDSTGAGIPDALLTGTDVQTSQARTTHADANGAYLITNLQIGEYTISVEAAGFNKYVQRGITLNVNQDARVDITLSVGDTTQTVQVNSESTGVDTRSATVGELVDHERIREMPLNGRNAMALAEIVPGVTNVLAAPTAQTQSRQGPSITVSGGRDTQNEFRFDGMTWKNITQNTGLNLPNPDALQEFQVITSNQSAEY